MRFAITRQNFRTITGHAGEIVAIDYANNEAALERLLVETMQ